MIVKNVIKEVSIKSERAFPLRKSQEALKNNQSAFIEAPNQHCRKWFRGGWRLRSYQPESLPSEWEREFLNAIAVTRKAATKQKESLRSRENKPYHKSDD